jgi:hypothetical protein
MYMRATGAIVQALFEKRCISFLPDNDVVACMRSGSDGSLFFPKFAELVDKIFNQYVVSYFVKDTDDNSYTRLSSRLFNAIHHVHRLLAEVSHDLLQNRCFVIVLGEPGSPLIFQALQMDRESPMIRSSEYFFTPPVYVGLSVFDVLAYARRSGEDELLERLTHSFFNEEAMRSGLSYIRDLPTELVYLLDRTLDGVLQNYHVVIQGGGNRKN